MYIRKRLALAVAISALGFGMVDVGPAQADHVTHRNMASHRLFDMSQAQAVQPLAVKGKWMYNYKNPRGTKEVQSYGKVQMCFNVKGDHLYQGYTVEIIQAVGGIFAHHKTLWSKNYWGPKHKTCTPWKSAGHDKVWGYINPIKFPQSHAAAQVWIYNP
ncbi:hypothetical protein [Streptomyces glomeratus]|uniref:Uncharacterized protein n=1 Tax=Streptomyces glomeratus TaxID=284452 RepID=A0ABP6LNT1_9ACTN|nr:hypothetical protein [Streptomyces glomeratus]MCF1512326.1 hypothetical protein [Streptomyces glomeratus]